MSEVPGGLTNPVTDASREEPPTGAAPPEPPERGTKRPRRGTPDEGGPSRPGVIEAVADLLQYIVDWLRQEATSIVHDRIVLPLQKLGLTLASGCAAALLAALGIAFIAVAVFMLLGQWLTYPGALLLTGGILVLGAIVFTVIKMRSMQK